MATASSTTYIWEVVPGPQMSCISSTSSRGAQFENFSAPATISCISCPVPATFRSDGAAEAFSPVYFGIKRRPKLQQQRRATVLPDYVAVAARGLALRYCVQPSLRADCIATEGLPQPTQGVEHALGVEADARPLGI